MPTPVYAPYGLLLFSADRNAPYWDAPTVPDVPASVLTDYNSRSWTARYWILNSLLPSAGRSGYWLSAQLYGYDDNAGPNMDQPFKPYGRLEYVPETMVDRVHPGPIADVSNEVMDHYATIGVVPGIWFFAGSTSCISRAGTVSLWTL